MTAADLRDIFLSNAYKRDLQDISSYLASIMQERPIVHCLAKHLWKAGRAFQLEAKHTDLVVEGTHIEFKFNYDTVMRKLMAESAKHGQMQPQRMVGEKMPWSAGPRIRRDILGKKPDIFVWTICSRDLSGVAEEQCVRICWSKEQRKFNQKYPYPDSGRACLDVVDSFLEELQTVPPSTILKAEIVARGDFPSTYHFRIWDLSSGKQTQS